MMKLATVLATVVAGTLAADEMYNTEAREVELIPYSVIGNNVSLSALEKSYLNVVNNFSFYMTCEPSAFQSNGNGLWDRLAFRTALANSYNVVAAAERVLFTSLLGSTRPNGDITETVNSIYYLLDTNLNEHPAFDAKRSMFNNITFDRVLESTAKGYVGFDERNSDPAYWNVFVRASIVVPRKIAEEFTSVIVVLRDLYPQCSINMDSIWVEYNAAFITEQLEPVRGRGHKSQKLLIPLIMGVISMLVIPMLLSLCAVKVAQSKHRSQKILNYKTAELEMYAKKNVVANAEIQVYDEKLQADRERDEAIEAELHQRDTHELTAEEVDWKASQ